MTSELEQKFYDTFGIEPISKWHKCKDYNCICCDEYESCSREEFIYSNITAEKLLGMICVYNKFQNNCDKLFTPINIHNLKENLLTLMIKEIKDETANKYFCNDVEKCKIKIQQLFNGGNK